LFCSLGFLLGELDDEPLRVWIPKDSAAVDNKDEVEDLYGEGNVIRYTIYITAKNDDEPNLITPDVMNEIISLDSTIKSVENDGIKYSEICEKLKFNYRCTMYESPLAFWENEDGTYTVDANSPF
jgi:hypothetical protein